MNQLKKVVAVSLVSIAGTVGFSQTSSALSFGEVLGIGAGVVVVDQVIKSNNNSAKDRYTPKSPQEEFYRGVQDGQSGARYDNPRNSYDYDGGYNQGLTRRRGF
jgi:hypothetical protein